MKDKARLLIGLSLIMVLVIAGVLVYKRNTHPQTLTPSTTMNITSSAFKEGERIPALYTCQGRDINPPLRFSAVPGVAQSLALIMDDPDAPMGTWTHWTMWNIDPTELDIPEHYAPSQEVEGRTSRGMPGYHGPCPPSGVHRYFFKLYALDTMLDISTETDASGLVEAMQSHIIAQAQLMGTYEKGSKL